MMQTRSSISHPCMNSYKTWTSLLYPPSMLTIKFITLAVKISTLFGVPLKDVSRRKKTDRKMSPELIILENASKVAHHIWKEAGSSSEHGHHAAEDRSRARSHLRRTLRHAETPARISHYEDLITASGYDRRKLHALIRRQRMSDLKVPAITVNGYIINEEEKISREWVNYF